MPDDRQALNAGLVPYTDGQEVASLFFLTRDLCGDKNKCKFCLAVLLSSNPRNLGHLGNLKLFFFSSSGKVYVYDIGTDSWETLQDVLSPVYEG